MCTLFGLNVHVCYNEIVVPNCKKREAGENLLFHLDFASDCKKYSHNTFALLNTLVGSITHRHKDIFLNGIAF